MAKAIASPSVRTLAARHGIDLDLLAQELGRETLGREDVEIAAGRPARAAASYWDVDHSAYGPVTEEAVSRVGLAAAGSLAAAQSLIPAATHHDQAQIGKVEDFRKSLEVEVNSRGLKLTALAFHVTALSKCLRIFPRFNSSLSPDGRSLILKRYVHIGIAVDTRYGLLVPVIRNADSKGVFAIAEDIADLAERAKGRKIRPEEMGGASMTISNLGGIGGTGFSPIVNPPEVAILGISRMRTEASWDGKAFRPTRIVPLGLSYDHRVVNGADAARFLSEYAGMLSDPRRLLL